MKSREKGTKEHSQYMYVDDIEAIMGLYMYVHDNKGYNELYMYVHDNRGYNEFIHI